MTAGSTPRRITRADIEAKLREIHGGLESGAQAGRDLGRTAAIAGVALVLGVAYLLGRRHGRKKRTVVEIKRI